MVPVSLFPDWPHQERLRATKILCVALPNKIAKTLPNCPFANVSNMNRFMLNGHRNQSTRVKCNVPDSERSGSLFKPAASSNVRVLGHTRNLLELNIPVLTYSGRCSEQIYQAGRTGPLCEASSDRSSTIASQAIVARC
jgi:hypothetical protein